MTSCQQIVTSLSFLWFMTNLEQSGSRIPDTQCLKLIFSLIATFCLIKTEDRTKRSLTQFSHYCSKSRYYFCYKKQIFYKKNVDISKVNRALVLKGIFSETTYVCVLTYQISSFQHNSNEFQTGEIILPPHLKTNP